MQVVCLFYWPMKNVKTLIIKTIKKCDPFCTPNSNVEKAWMSIRKRIYEGLQIPLVEMDFQNNNAKNGANYNHTPEIIS